jgi:hypothetical protein
MELNMNGGADKTIKFDIWDRTWVGFVWRNVATFYRTSAL